MMNKATPKSPDGKPYGIRVDLLENDPMCAPHLLGDEWAGTRWFESAVARDEALESMRIQPGYYRRGDSPSIILSVIDPD